VIGVAWTGSEQNFEEFIDRHGLSFPNISDGPGAIYDRFGVPYQPAFALVDADGNVETLIGAADDDVLDMLINNLVS
jgi:peroxiredoxin